MTAFSGSRAVGFEPRGCLSPPTPSSVGASVRVLLFEHGDLDDGSGAGRSLTAAQLAALPPRAALTFSAHVADLARCAALAASQLRTEGIRRTYRSDLRLVGEEDVTVLWSIEPAAAHARRQCELRRRS